MYITIILFFGLFAHCSSSLNFNYIGKVTKISTSGSASPRYIPFYYNLWAPLNWTDATHFFFGDHWYTDPESSHYYLVPMWFDRKFVVRYRFVPDYHNLKTVNQTWTDAEMQKITEALDALSDRICVKFMPLKEEFIEQCNGHRLLKYRIAFKKTRDKTLKTCSSEIGLQRWKSDTVIDVGPQCGLTDLVHETMHTLGFIHEHQRIDRDDYVRIIDRKDHPDDYRIHNAAPMFNMDYKSKDYKYDFDSIMHYPLGKQYNLEALDPNVKQHHVYDKNHLYGISQGDSNKLYFYYGCQHYGDLYYIFKPLAGIYYNRFIIDFWYWHGGWHPIPGQKWVHSPDGVDVYGCEKYGEPSHPRKTN